MGAGERSSIVNTRPSDYIMKEGDVLRLDFGAVYRGYCSDISRSAVVGEPSQRQMKVYESLLQGYYRMVEKAKPGVKFSELFRIGISTVRKVFPQYWRRHLGHGIGLTTHERPYIRL